MRRLAGLVVSTVAVFGSLVPLSGSPAEAARSKSKKERESRRSGFAREYECERDSPAGKIVASHRTLLMALRQMMSPGQATTKAGPSSIRKLGKIKAVSR